MCVCKGSGISSMELTYTRRVPGMQGGVAVGMGTVHGVGPPTRMSTSPMSFLSSTDVKVRPPLSDRATCVPPVCHATYIVPSERSTAMDGSLAPVSEDGETRVVNPVDASAVWLQSSKENPATAGDHHRLFMLPSS